MTDLQLQSTITCPKCNGKTIEQMPTDYCQYFWECPHCKNNLKPKEGDCRLNLNISHKTSFLLL